MKELVVISGKGGTGKTSVVASFAALAKNKVLADCDVDAADLHLILSPKILRREEFSGGKTAVVTADQCIGCGKCASVCRFDAISFDGPANEVVGKTYHIDPIACEGCGVCAYVCPVNAISLVPSVNGEWFVSETRHGPMIHAKLGIAQENSGKLVTIIRREAKKIAEENGFDLVIIDGSPGIGCPVIASITGASLALIVTEPTLSALHDLDRVANLVRHFGIPTVACVNKSDVNPDVTIKIREHCLARNIDMLGEIRYDTAVILAQIKERSVVEYDNSIAAQDITSLWNAVNSKLNNS
ncbi:MAG: ATP-binding protein [Armatimonadota bacterium]|nr:ATP-binding protein [Armatimonadota bacterium]